MKFSLIIVLASLGTILFASEEHLVATAYIHHAYSVGYFDVNFDNPPVESDRLRLAVDTSCLPYIGIQSIEYINEQGGWRTATYLAGGFVQMSGNKFYELRVTNTNSSVYALDCHWSFYAESPTGGETLVGVLRYSGGFAEKLRFDLKNPQKVSYFRLQVPTFCKDVDILEAGTISEGEFVEAKATGGDQREFSVNDGAGYYASAISASLNGPESKICNIPIYVK
jgi:hypothetical protein